MDSVQYLRAAVMLGSETHEVALRDVDVPDDHISFFGDAESLNAALSTAFFTFELLVSASYVDVASGLVEAVLEQRRGTAGERVALVGELEAVMASLEAVARAPLGGTATRWPSPGRSTCGIPRSGSSSRWLRMPPSSSAECRSWAVGSARCCSPRPEHWPSIRHRGPPWRMHSTALCSVGRS